MWFRDLVGFDETTPDEVRARLSVDGDRMTSLVNGRRLGCGTLEIPSVAELRERSTDVVAGAGPTTIGELVGDAGALHREESNRGATFQAASQFNLLEMISPTVTPEAGIDGYELDPTQGPACAVACGAGTIYRNYFVELNGRVGQSADNQIDCLADIHRYLFDSQSPAWTMQNGYALFDRRGLDRVNTRLDSLSEAERDQVKARLRVGVQRDVEVTTSTEGHLVTQVYCSALPVSHSQLPPEAFEPLARLILAGAYEATLRVAAINAAQTGNRSVFLTLVGGGVWGNPASWIIDAIDRACSVVADAGLDVVVVSHRRPNPALTELITRPSPG